MLINRNWLFILLVVGVVIVSCSPAKLLSKKQATETAEAAEAKIATLQLELPQTEFSAGEAIPVKLTLELDKFDLIFPEETVEGSIAFSGLVLKTTSGGEVKPNKSFGVEAAPKTLYEKGAAVKGVPAIELEANSKISANLENLADYYSLTNPGRYSLQLVKELKVYKKTLIEKSPEVRELEEAIANVQNSPNLPADAKRDAVAALQSDLQLYMADENAARKFLTLDSFRGKTVLQSNIVEFTIQ